MFIVLNLYILNREKIVKIIINKVKITTQIDIILDDPSKVSIYIICRIPFYN